MTKYMIIAKVNGKDYLTKVNAESALEAEHMILDRGVNGRHEYGVDACMAYDVEMTDTDCFRGAMFYADPVSVDELMKIIDENNEKILRKDAAEEEMKRLEKMMKELDAQMKEAKEQYAKMNRIAMGL